MTNSFFLWLVAQTPDNALNPWELIKDASWVVQGVMLLLLVASVATWAVIFWKLFLLSAAKRENQQFTDSFWSAGSLDAAIRASKAHPNSSLTRIFEAGLQEFNQISELKLSRGDTIELLESNVARSLQKAARAEIELLQKFNSFLANVASVAPFVGLFGTVWGIMHAFLDINTMGSTDLVAVAPGIAEALIATAMGLFAAIPAVIFYNYFVSFSKKLNTSMSNFSSEFLNTAKRSL